VCKSNKRAHPIKECPGVLTISMIHGKGSSGSIAFTSNTKEAMRYNACFSPTDMRRSKRRALLKVIECGCLSVRVSQCWCEKEMGIGSGREGESEAGVERGSFGINLNIPEDECSYFRDDDRNIDRVGAKTRRKKREKVEEEFAVGLEKSIESRKYTDLDESVQYQQNKGQARNRVNGTVNV